MRINSTGEVLTIYLEGEIDHHSARSMREEIDKAIDFNMPSLLILDFTGITFMDSSGVGLVMGRYRNVSAHGGRLEAVNLPPWCYRIMKLSGLEKIAKIQMSGGRR